MAKEDTKRVGQPRFDAAITDDQMVQIDRTAKSMDVARRIALATLTRSADQLLENFNKETARALLDGVENITNYLEWRKQETEFLEAARARILLVLSGGAHAH